MILASYTIHSKKKDKAEKPVVQVRTAFMGAKDIQEVIESVYTYFK